MKKLISYLRDYKKETFVAPLFKLLEAGFELIVPLIVAMIIDDGIAKGDKPLIFRMSLVLLSLALIGWTCAVVAQYFAAKAAVGATAKIKADLFGKIMSLSFSETDTLGNSTMITRMTSDCALFQNAVNLFLRLFLRAPIIVFGAMIMAFTISVKAALVFVGVIPLLSLVVFGIMQITVPLYRKVQEKLDGLLGITRENLTGARVLRAFCREDEEIKQFSETNKSLSAMQVFVGKIAGLTNLLTFLLINTAIIVLIYVGALEVNSGSLTQGEVIALYNYMSQILVELIKLASLIVTVTKGYASAKRITAVLEMPSEVTEEKNCGKEVTSGKVEFRNVSLTYKNAGAPSLSNISFVANPGEIIGVIGGTGSGKSSVINLIPGFYPASEGSVEIDGSDISDYDPDTLRKSIGVVPQYAKLFRGTVRENMLCGNEDATDDEIWQALKDAQAYDFIMQKDGKLDYMIENGGKNLSGGQKQRLTVARALVRRPKILILDDSTSALDYKTDSLLRKAVADLDYKPTVFIVSQRASSVLNSDKTVVLEDGECVGYGSPAELLKNCDVYREIYRCQFPEQV